MTHIIEFFFLAYIGLLSYGFAVHRGTTEYRWRDASNDYREKQTLGCLDVGRVDNFFVLGFDHIPILVHH